MLIENQVQSKTPDVWKFNNLKRWKITAILETISPLHIGSGDLLTTKIHSQEVDVNGFIKGINDQPIIPGSTLKGKLRAYLAKNLGDHSLDKLDKVFGKAHKNDSEQGSGGLAEFHDAQLCAKSDIGNFYSHWQADKQTYIEVSTAIERHTKTALDGSLHYTECVAPKTQFEIIVTGDMQEQDAALIIKALKIFSDENNKLHLGADNANAKGRMVLVGKVHVNLLENDNIIDWLDKNSTQKMVTTAFVDLTEDTDKIKAIVSQAPEWTDIKQENSFDITLQFDGPFMVNDPSKQPEKKQTESNLTDHILLTDEKNNAVLPEKSFRGALRSQAERIIRTMGGNCCDNNNPCKDTNHRCIACEMFGSTGWKTTINIGPFSLIKSLPLNDQQFVAIDRFHGGGKDEALFSNRHVEYPEFEGTLSLDIRKLNEDELIWRKGLLGLVFRDLKEGDISFGLGVNKGYGKIKKATISNENSISQEDIEAFRLKCKNSFKDYPCNNVIAPQPGSNNKTIQSPVSNAKSANQFHNPYHFIPVKDPDTTTWLKIDELSIEKTHHSHAFYRDKDKEDNALHHGRIICKLTAETPFFIGAEDASKTDQEDSEAKLKEHYKLNGDIAIPATSLRGMISSLAEAASNSALRVLDDGLLSYRKSANQALKGIGMIFKSENDDWHLIPMKSMSKNSIQLKGAYINVDIVKFLKDKHSWSPEHNVVYYLSADNPDSLPPSTKHFANAVCVILRILGKDENRKAELQNKKNEILIEIDEKYVNTDNNTFDYLEYKKNNNTLPVSPEAITRYTELANQRSKSQKNAKDLKDDVDCSSTKWLPFHLKGAKRKKEEGYCKLALNDYDLVYFSKERGIINEIAFSAIWRDKVKHKVNAFFPDDLVPFNQERQSISPAELLFGFVELNEEENKRDHALAFAGKVRVGEGILLPPDRDKVLYADEITLKALSTPKLPSPALYYKNSDDENTYITKADLQINSHHPQGRKIYLHAMRWNNDAQKFTEKGIPASSGAINYPWESHQPQVNKKLKVRIKPVNKGTHFFFQIDFSNLSDWELGLLCFSLRPNDSFRHKLGMGKPIGLGSVKIDIAALQTVNRTQRYKEDDIDNTRYNAINWLNNEYRDELENQYDITNKIELSGDKPDTFRKIFSQTMDEDIYRAIDLLGNPANIDYPVHYPQIENKSIEEENYKWFVANDIGTEKIEKNKKPRKEAMSSITKESTRIPTLTRHKWND